ncbi:two-component system chemotaxis sensor kinase CheA [Anaerobacterium chartisolvens]|uniref:histidine kinase n=1 Tax=Anaerobacterium chartisolvens TaxID=1297424 RepID=A0A369BD72_9FIRM|nr:ATP-binding protein [Anaerobacterium chartisolvens]RCX17624.1 two-component system chemotaxis sensor kinase CheA [Anaerobacterium chartisolvens]
MFYESDFLFSTDDEIVYHNGQKIQGPHKWTIMIADEDRDIHKAVKSSLQEFVFEGIPLEFLSAFSVAEAANLFKERLYIAIAFIHKSIGGTDKGIDLVRLIREELGDKAAGIILRIEPGEDVEEGFITEYCVSDCKEKSELVRKKLFTAVSSLLNAYKGSMRLKRGMLRNKNMSRIIDNSSQGFLTFGQTLIINDYYSSECIKIFKRRIEGVKFSELIHADTEQQHNLNIMLTKILNIHNSSIREFYLPLLPAQIYVEGRYIAVKYIILNGEAPPKFRMFMLILNDITDKKLLENKAEEERSNLRMIVSVVANYDEFLNLCKEYRDFCGLGIIKILDSSSDEGIKLFDILRSIHNFKSSFSKLNMVNIVNKLHEIESRISMLRNSTDEEIAHEMEECLLQIRPELLEQDLDLIATAVGEDFYIGSRPAWVDKDKIDELEKKMTSILSDEQCRLLLPEVRKLGHRLFRDLLKHYPAYVAVTARRLGKEIFPLIIKGGDFYADIRQYQSFTESLVHVFKNAVDHGIEEPVRREEKGKDRLGSIRCGISLQDEYICVCISDDGRGIDLEEIRKISFMKGICTYEEAYEMPVQEVMGLVFHRYMTTKMTADSFSGRGIGLTAVKDEVGKIGGRVEVNSRKDEGTEFKFWLKHVV